MTAVEAIALAADELSRTPDTIVSQWPLSGGDSSAEVGALLDRMRMSTAMRVPPFRFDYVLGDGDLPWLRRWEASFRAEVEALKQQGELHQGDVDLIARRYRALLHEVAQERFARHGVSQRFLADHTLLRDLPFGSPQHTWLTRMLDAACGGAIWDFGGLHRSDQSLVAATDLVVLRTVTDRALAVARRLESERGAPLDDEGAAALRRAWDALGTELREYLAGR